MLEKLINDSTAAAALASVWKGATTNQRSNTPAAVRNALDAFVAAVGVPAGTDPIDVVFVQRRTWRRRSRLARRALELLRDRRGEGGALESDLRATSLAEGYAEGEVETDDTAGEAS